MSRRVIRMLAISGTVTAMMSVGAAGVATASQAGAATRGAGARQAHLSLRAIAGSRYCGRRHVTVVVDFTHFHNGKVWVRCASDPRTGLAALRQAGFTYSFVHNVPGFICRINGRPNPCNGAPTTAYWAYWHARHGGHWTYSTLGAGSYHPRRGQVEGWAFGARRKPRISPP